MKFRVKDIKHLQDRTKFNADNIHFTNIINITESDYEDYEQTIGFTTGKTLNPNSNRITT